MKKNIIITVLAVLLLGLGVYVVTDKVLNKEVKQENKKEEVVEKIENFDKEEAKTIVEKYLHGLFAKTIEKEIKDGLSEDYRLFLAITYAEKSNFDYKCKEAFPNSTLDEYGFYNINEGNFAGACSENRNPDEYSGATYEEVNKSYKKLFGNEKDAPKKNTSFGLDRYGYSEKYDAYIKLDCRCGGSYFPDRYLDITNATIQCNRLEVTFKYAVMEYTYENSNYKVCINNSCKTVDNVNSFITSGIEEFYEENKDIVKEYKFTFNKGTDGCYFVKSEKVD